MKELLTKITYPIRVRVAFVLLTLIYLIAIFCYLFIGIVNPRAAIHGINTMVGDIQDMYNIFNT